MPMNQTFYQFTTVQLVIVISAVIETRILAFKHFSIVCQNSLMHLEIMKLQLLVTHLTGVDWNVHMLGNVTKKGFKVCMHNLEIVSNAFTLSPFEGFRGAKLAVAGHDDHDDVLHLVEVVVDGDLMVDDVEQVPKLIY
jgi:hypothetical protein